MLYFYFRFEIWRHRSVLRPRFPIRRGEFRRFSHKLRLYCILFQCACAKLPCFYSAMKCHCCVPRPKFRMWRRNSSDSRTFKAEIGTFMFAWIFLDLLAQNGGFGSKIGEVVVRCWPQWTRSYLWGLLFLCHFWRKSTKKCDRESAHRQTDRSTGIDRDAVTETNWVNNLCPMLYAIAMGQIKINLVKCKANSLNVSFVN